MREIIVDNFAGGGGASTGIEMAIGRSVDVAINHDPAAIAMHKANHPSTEHYCESVWDVNPVKACRGRPVALAWFSPDCKHFSKAKGSKPKDKTIRGLAWVALRWAAKVRPRVIMLENVEEFKTWGPLNRSHRPIKSKQGHTFNKFIKQLEDLGYKVDYRELRACDYGAPTTRKRFFLIARCDGKKIVWPESTHAEPGTIEVEFGLKKPYRTAAEIIDWSIPVKSIFDRPKPLAENTLKRIARGLEKFVFNNPEPFIVSIGHTGFCKDRSRSIHEPLNTIVSKAEQCLVTPYLAVNNTGHPGGNIENPVPTITTGGHHALIAPMLTQYHTETNKNEVRGQKLTEPIMTLDASPRYALASATLIQTGYGEREGQAPRVPGLTKPLGTVVSTGKHALVTAFLSKYYSGNYTGAGGDVKEPLHTITTKERFALVQAFLSKYNSEQDYNYGIVTVNGEQYKIVDIGMRMLEPHELFLAQGFPSDYIIDRDYKGKPYPKTAQVARCGNAVCPPIPEALVRANLSELCDSKKQVSGL